MTTLHLRKSTDRSPLRRGVLLTPLALAMALLALLPTARAADGGLPNDSTAEGINALVNQNNSGFGNTAMGWNALAALTGASFNTAVGDQALLNNTSGTENTATGAGALFKNTTGNNNTADGLEALFSNTTGFDNTADGILALENNIGGHDNIAVGFQALKGNTT